MIFFFVLCLLRIVLPRGLLQVELLRQVDHHPNVVRYYCVEHDGDFVYIALQLCLCSLVQVRQCVRG